MQPTKQQIQQWAKGSTLTRVDVDQHTVHETQNETPGVLYVLKRDKAGSPHLKLVSIDN